MRIAYVLPYLKKPSGWRSHACAFISAIRQEIQPILIVAASDYKIAQTLFSGDTILPVPATQEAALNSLPGMLRFAASFAAIRRGYFPKVDLVHSLEAYPTGLVGYWLAQRLGCPHIMTVNGTYGVVWYKSLLDRPVYAQVLRNTAMICPASHGTARIMLHYFNDPLAHTQIHPIAHGNNFYKTIPPKIALERVLPPTPTLLSVGQIKSRKGYLISLAAFAKVRDQLPTARYRIVGDTSDQGYYRKLQKFISEQHLEGVEFTGMVSQDDMRRMYQEASVFVLTPMMDDLHFEGFGLVYLEAGAYGLPVVATDSGGVSDAVKDGETGFLASEGDVDGVAQAILRLLNNPELAQRMGRAGRAWSEMLAWERSVKEHLQVYEEMVRT